MDRKNVRRIDWIWVGFGTMLMWISRYFELELAAFIFIAGALMAFNSLKHILVD